MIQEFVDTFMAKKAELRESLGDGTGLCYRDLVNIVVKLLDTSELDPERIVEIDHGDYQGTQLYVIAEKGYQPYRYHYVMVSYGSCSGCDTMCAVMDCVDKEERLRELVTLALHIVQGLKLME